MKNVCFSGLGYKKIGTSAQLSPYVCERLGFQFSEVRSFTEKCTGKNENIKQCGRPPPPPLPPCR